MLFFATLVFASSLNEEKDIKSNPLIRIDDLKNDNSALTNSSNSENKIESSSFLGVKEEKEENIVSKSSLNTENKIQSSTLEGVDEEKFVSTFKFYPYTNMKNKLYENFKKARAIFTSYSGTENEIKNSTLERVEEEKEENLVCTSRFETENKIDSSSLEEIQENKSVCSFSFYSNTNIENSSSEKFEEESDTFTSCSSTENEIRNSTLERVEEEKEEKNVAKSSFNTLSKIKCSSLEKFEENRSSQNFEKARAIFTSYSSTENEIKNSTLERVEEEKEEKHAATSTFNTENKFDFKSLEGVEMKNFISTLNFYPNTNNENSSSEKVEEDCAVLASCSSTENDIRKSTLERVEENEGENEEENLVLLSRVETENSFSEKVKEKRDENLIATSSLYTENKTQSNSLEIEKKILELFYTFDSGSEINIGNRSIEKVEEGNSAPKSVSNSEINIDNSFMTKSKEDNYDFTSISTSEIDIKTTSSEKAEADKIVFKSSSIPEIRINNAPIDEFDKSSVELLVYDILSLFTRNFNYEVLFRILYISPEDIMFDLNCDKYRDICLDVLSKEVNSCVFFDEYSFDNKELAQNLQLVVISDYLIAQISTVLEKLLPILEERKKLGNFLENINKAEIQIRLLLCIFNMHQKDLLTDYRQKIKKNKKGKKISEKSLPSIIKDNNMNFYLGHVKNEKIKNKEEINIEKVNSEFVKMNPEEKCIAKEAKVNNELGNMISEEKCISKVSNKQHVSFNIDKNIDGKNYKLTTGFSYEQADKNLREGTSNSNELELMKISEMKKENLMFFLLLEVFDENSMVPTRKVSFSCLPCKDNKNVE